ncbi:MAG: DUF2157 domain-containing protein [Oscillospiraceae bacterium]|nr:DUF2157 domain-containing protein [Oscillospiraceae bacterium]
MNQNNNYEHLYPSSPPPQPYKMDSTSVDTGFIPPNIPVSPPPAYMPPPMVQTVPKVKKPFSPIPLLLIAGVAFLFLGGIIFLTGTWDIMPNMGRAITLLSASVIAFGANLLAERGRKLQKTGLAFYILGCIFLPLALGGIGVFQLFGEWFSFDGDGSSLLWAVICISVALTSFLGQSNYKSAFLAWLSLSGFGGAWTFVALFLTRQLLMPMGVSLAARSAVGGALWVLFAIGATVWTELYLRKKQDTPFAKAALAFLYPLLLLYSMLISVLTSQSAPLAACVLLLVMAILFGNERFVSGVLHIGIFGALLCLYRAAACIPSLGVFSDCGIFSGMLFTMTSPSLLLMGTHWLPKTSPALRNTFRITSLIIGIPAVLLGVIMSFFDESCGGWLFLLYALLALGAVFFLVTLVAEKGKHLPKDALLFCMRLMLLFLAAMNGIREETHLFSLLLVIGALLLLAEAFFGRKLWQLATAIGACIAMLLMNVPHTAIFLLWLCVVGMTAAVIYAHLTRRGLLEKSAAWTAIAFLLTAFMPTVRPWIHFDQRWILCLALVTLLYLLETVVFWGHARTSGTRLYLEVTAVFIAVIANGFYLGNSELMPGWSALLLLLLAVFSVVFTKKRVNVASTVPLFLLFFDARHLLVLLEKTELPAVLWIQAGGFILLLVLFAVMGRVLLSDGFVNMEEGKCQIDFPLLAGVLPVCSVAVTIDWYPSILVCLFLSIYSLLYVGRLKNHRIPALLASGSFCMTLLFHNIHDPFNLFAVLYELDMKSPQLLLYLLPMHLFILSMLVILPECYRDGVHMARFGMYCITMLCLLFASMSFGNVADAIILVVFSFLILAGSFTVKRLRWFTLGFAVLVVMTLRLTWSFWQSLHWGIYLFLAGMLLITLASVYELSARKAAENPDAPKKKFRLFATWNW